jgi:hypothetical protein
MAGSKRYESQPIWSTRRAPPVRDLLNYVEELGMDTPSSSAAYGATSMRT